MSPKNVPQTRRGDRLPPHHSSQPSDPRGVSNLPLLHVRLLRAKPTRPLRGFCRWTVCSAEHTFKSSAWEPPISRTGTCVACCCRRIANVSGISKCCSARRHFGLPDRPSPYTQITALANLHEIRGLSSLVVVVVDACHHGRVAWRLEETWLQDVGEWLKDAMIRSRKPDTGATSSSCSGPPLDTTTADDTARPPSKPRAMTEAYALARLTSE